MEKKESPSELRPSHTPSAIRQRIRHGHKHSYLKDFIYGATDGAVTTFAVVSGVAGAGLPHKVVIILGVANLVGDGFSMAVSNFLATRAEDQQRQQARANEEHHIRTVPEGEKEEIRQIFAAKGFEGRELEHVVEVITADHQEWINTMMKEELGLTLQGPSPWKAGLTTFSAFVMVGALPLLPFLLQWAWSSLTLNAYMVSTIITGMGFFLVGTFKSRFVGQGWLSSGLETLIVGGCAALLAFLVGVFLKGLVPG